MKNNAEIRLWGTVIGAVSLDDQNRTADFEYNPSFVQSGIQLSPVVMPLKKGIYRFPELPYETYHGLPGLVSDSLPDKFGNSIIDVWLSKQGRLPESFNAVERLCYTGKRGMGALEYYPVIASENIDEKINVSELVELASMVLRNRKSLNIVLDECNKAEMNTALSQIISVGTSAGGARAKAVIAWNPETNEVRSGQTENSKGFEHWLIKFSGVAGNKDKEDEDREDFGIIEYTYYLMAKEAGINMSECRILDDGKNSHFMTKRFDRDDKGNKFHMQTLCAMAHMDFNQAGAYSYEQFFSVMNKIGLHHLDSVEAFKRMVFNIYAFNCDDHTKNISFLMDKQGQWKLSPAYDVSFAYNPNGLWTSSHQMTVNGKRKNFTELDFENCAKFGNLSHREVKNAIADVKTAVSNWKIIAKNSGVSQRRIDEIWEFIKISL
ncbi:MAG: type II toxin-antitoxin system HipA family toxin [Treponemataceae bacterium]|nr:type II toxin-antitoxin system HipA family toxin [Treponemataceae bacterium]